MQRLRMSYVKKILLKVSALHSIESFKDPRPSILQRFSDGRALRKKVSLRDQGIYIPKKNRLDPISILEKQAATRIQSLMPIRYGRMIQSPFNFYRGSAAIMAQDLANQPTTNITVQLCGDMHVSNFGLFGTAEHRLVFGINDFDETLPGSWEWDLKRLVASAIIACESIGGNSATSKELVYLISSAYQKKMAHYAKMPFVDIANEYILEKDIRKNFSKAHQKKLDLFLKATKSESNIGVLEEFTKIVGKNRKIINSPPLIEHFSKNFKGTPSIDLINKALLSYSSTLLEDREVLFKRYSLKDFARKVSGIGSVGTNCMLLYFVGDNQNDPLFLQYKEAQRSVLSPYLGESIYSNQGRRVVAGQRLLQGAPDSFLNYGGVEFEIDQTQGFYIRQLRDLNGGISFGPDGVSLENFPDYASLFGWALALGHARSGDAAMIAGYCGESKQLDAALYSFAKSYAIQNKSDYQVFCKAVQTGRIKIAKNCFK